MLLDEKAFQKRSFSYAFVEGPCIVGMRPFETKIQLRNTVMVHGMTEGTVSARGNFPVPACAFVHVKTSTAVPDLICLPTFLQDLLHASEILEEK
jgi:hypothetical protein